MKLTLRIPKHLIQAALDLTNAKNQNQVVELALQELIQPHKLSRLKQFKGKVDLSEPYCPE